jgi:3',5'-cyclic AMP phosphodiesterase CpdA
LLVWDRDRQAQLFPFREDRHAALESILWILRHIERGALKRVRADYSATFGVSRGRPTTIIQLSDVHLGSEEANVRLPRLQQHVTHLFRDHAESSDVLIAVTGDLMDTPDDEHLDRVRAFLQFLSTFDTPSPLILLGNHDVRHRGFLRRELGPAFEIPSGSSPSGVRRFDDLGLAIVCVNSVTGGNLATGIVGERQMIDLANALDHHDRREDVTLIGAVHHHPLPVDRPDWYASPFYERILGTTFERTDALEDAEAFMQFAREQRFSALIHGHKHIPRLSTDSVSGMPVIGCGSSVGKVATRDGTPYMSVNVVTIDKAAGRLSARLLASRAAGGRLAEEGSHQAVLVSSL